MRSRQRRAELRSLRNTPAELAQVDRLVMEAYGFSSRRNELEMYVAAQPDGWFVVDGGGELVAVGGAIAYGRFCWIGLVATHPARQRQGLAARLSVQLIDWARGLGCTTIALDASEAGQPVYEQLGFRVVGKTAELSLPVFDGHKPSSVAYLRAEDVEQLLVLDRQIFGGDRARLFPVLWRQPDVRCYVAKNNGEPAGYLFARKRLLGPGCARNDAVAGDLVRAALADRAATGEQRLLLPTESRYLDVLGRLGLRVERRLAHMRLGDPRLPGERDQLLAQTSYAAG